MLPQRRGTKGEHRRSQRQADERGKHGHKTGTGIEESESGGFPGNGQHQGQQEVLDQGLPGIQVQQGAEAMACLPVSQKQPLKQEGRKAKQHRCGRDIHEPAP